MTTERTPLREPVSVTDYDVVIGGGCVGLSTTRHLAERSDRDVRVLEKENQLVTHQSGRNSGVLYSTPDSTTRPVR